MSDKTERQVESYKIWAMAVLLTGVCLSLYYFHVILGIGTIVTHIFYVPIVLAAFWWKRKGLVVALFSSGLLIVSHVYLRPDMASHNDYFRAFMFIVTAFLVAELSRRIAKEQEALQTANQQLKADEQQLKANNQQLSANEQQLVSEVAARKSTEERIREQREFLRNTIESLSYPFYVIDVNDNTIKMANSTAWQGKLPEKLTCYMLSHKRNKPCDGADQPCMLEEVKKTKQPVTVEHIHYDKDGNPRNIEVHAYPIFDNEQNVTQIIEYCLDITDRKKVEKALEESKELLEKTFLSLDSAVFILDSKGPPAIINCNTAASRIFGYDKEEMLGKTTEFLHVSPEALLEFQKILYPALQKEGHLSFSEFQMKRKNGQIFPTEHSVIPLKDDKGNRIGWVSVVRDITERKKAEEKLRESELKFKTIFENAGGAIFIADNKTGKILECNSQAEKLLGRPRAEIIGMHQSELHPQGEEKKYKEKFAAHIQKGHVVDFEGEVQRRDGRRTPVWIAAQCLKIGGKDVIIGLFVDTTERKKAEKKLLDYQEQLKSLASQLSLTEENERRRIATKLHDQIGQSLVFSKLKLDELHHSATSSELIKALDEICNNIDQIIKDTRTLTFDLSSPILYELGFEVAVAEWLDGQIRDKHGIEIEFQDDGQPKPLDDDIRALLFRNVRELLINIVKHANAKKVKVSIHKVDDQMYVSIKDNGVGFNPAEVASKPTFGLFSIRQRLEQLGGHFEIDSEPGRGSRFTMTAPLKLAKTNSSPHGT